MKYAVKIREISERTVVVDTDSFDEAVKKVSDAHGSHEIILEADDFTEVKFIKSETFGENAIADDDKRLNLFTKLQ